MSVTSSRQPSRRPAGPARRERRRLLPPPPGVGVPGIARLDGHALPRKSDHHRHTAAIQGRGGDQHFGCGLHRLTLSRRPSAAEEYGGRAENRRVPHHHLGRREARRHRFRRRLKYDRDQCQQDSRNPPQSLPGTRYLLRAGLRGQRRRFHRRESECDRATFPAFSPNNTFAMFNDNTIDQSFVLPTPLAPPQAWPARGLRRDLHQQRGREHLQHRVFPWRPEPR